MGVVAFDCKTEFENDAIPKWYELPWTAKFDVWLVVPIPTFPIKIFELKLFVCVMAFEKLTKLENDAEPSTFNL